MKSHISQVGGFVVSHALQAQVSHNHIAMPHTPTTTVPETHVP
jgi:hypothetical protein